MGPGKIRAGHCEEKEMSEPSDIDLLRAEFETKLYVPGMWICSKCSYQLSLNYLYVKSSNVGANLSQAEPCPNDGTPMDRLTWEQHARDAVKTALQLVDRAVTAEAERDALGLNRPYDCYWSRRALAAEKDRAKFRALSVEAMVYCYDEANRLANHGHGGHDRMAMENLYAIANKARKELGLENVERKDWK